MRAASSALIALLNSGANSFLMADCYTFKLLNGNAYYYTSVDTPITFGGNTYSSTSVKVSGLNYRIETGLTVDEQTITIQAYPTDLIEGQPFLQALGAGVLDGAHITRTRVFFSAWSINAPGGVPVVVDSIVLFYGRVSSIDKLGRIEAQLKVKSELVQLARDFPRNLYQATCIHTLYDSGCGLSKAAHGAAMTVASGTTITNVKLTGSVTNAQPYEQGTITFTSGALNNVSATIKAWNNGSGYINVILAAPLPSIPAAGDTCMIYFGCDHTQGSNGCSKFSNLPRFRAFPYVPPVATGL